MSPLYVYALLDEAPPGDLGRGLGDEPLRLVACGDVLAVAGDLVEEPAVDADALRAHDRIARRLGELVRAVLPVRFGSFVSDESALVERLVPAAPALREALVMVAGREQMTMRVYGPSVATLDDSTALPDDDAVGAGAEDAEAGVANAGPGARYLARRQRQWRQEQRLVELAPLRPVLDRFVLAERVERNRTAPLLATAYHLVARGAGPAYTRAVEAAASGLDGRRVRVSGPWPPYAFAPELP